MGVKSLRLKYGISEAETTSRGPRSIQQRIMKDESGFLSGVKSCYIPANCKTF